MLFCSAVIVSCAFANAGVTTAFAVVGRGALAVFILVFTARFFAADVFIFTFALGIVGLLNKGHRRNNGLKIAQKINYANKVTEFSEIFFDQINKIYCCADKISDTSEGNFHASA
jgi:hypothetical protein